MCRCGVHLPEHTPLPVGAAPAASATLAPMGERRRQPAPGSGLHLCAFCRANFVVPVAVEEVDEARWRLLLRCGECQTYRDIVVTNDVAERYEQDLERGIAAVAAAYRRVDRERMAADVQVLIIALERDLIDASDFARG